jgi:hypothetical protein
MASCTISFIAIDAFSVDPVDAVLWTGSMNFTDQQVNVDANNVIIFHDQSLAKAYEMEFGEMWSGVFGPDKTNNTPKEFNVGGNRVELYFSPSDDTESEIRRTIETTDHDLEFCVYSYTRFSISYSIDDMTTFGVYGGGVVDDSTNGGYAMSILQQNMTNTLFIANHSYLVHNKYLLADANAPGLDPIVLTGSHNWTTSAQTKNDENTVVVHNAAIANQYYQEWVARYKDEGGTVLPGLLIGIDEASSSLLQLSMFPNPASEWLQVKYDLPYYRNCTAECAGSLRENCFEAGSKWVSIFQNYFSGRIAGWNVLRTTEFRHAAADGKIHGSEIVVSLSMGG